MFTFGDIHISLPVINIEAPQEARNKVKEISSNVVAKPCPEEVREWGPQGVRQEASEQYAVVELGVFDEQMEILTPVVHWKVHR